MQAVQEPIKIFKGAIKIFVVVLVVEPERKIMFYQETEATLSRNQSKFVK